MRGIIAVVVVAISLLVVGFGSYSMGQSAGRADGLAVRTQFLQQRGGTGVAASSTGQRGQSAGGTQVGQQGRPAVVGTIDQVDGSTMVVTTNNASVKVQVADGTPIQKQTSGALADLKPGERVLVQGQQNADGSYQAASIQLTGEGQQAAPAAGRPNGGPRSANPAGNAP